MENPEEIGHVYIPAHIMARTDLTIFDKVLYGKIIGLTKEGGYCYASNEWLSKQLGKHSVWVSKEISKFVKLHLLSREIIYKEGSREIQERRLYPFTQENECSVDIPISVEAKTPLSVEAKEIQEIQSAKHTAVKKKKADSLPAGVVPTSKNSLTACTDLEVWELAVSLNIPIEYVRTKHARILDMIESGEFQRKYRENKTVYKTLLRWLQMDIERNYCQHCNEIELIENQNEHPDNVAKRNEALKIVAEMRKRGEF